MTTEGIVGKSLAKQMIDAGLREPEKPKIKTKKLTKPEKKKLTQFQIFKKIVSPQKKKVMTNKIRLIKLQNIQLKRKIQLEKLRQKQKKIITPPPIPVYIKPPPQRFFASPMINADIDSIFADVGHADGNIFGYENYYGDEEFYTENFFGNEFNTPPMEQLQIRPRRGVSPLLW